MKMYKFFLNKGFDEYYKKNLKKFIKFIKSEKYKLEYLSEDGSELLCYGDGILEVLVEKFPSMISQFQVLDYTEYPQVYFAYGDVIECEIDRFEYFGRDFSSLSEDETGKREYDNFMKEMTEYGYGFLQIEEYLEKNKRV